MGTANRHLPTIVGKQAMGCFNPDAQFKQMFLYLILLRGVLTPVRDHIFGCNERHRHVLAAHPLGYDATHIKTVIIENHRRSIGQATCHDIIGRQDLRALGLKVVSGCG